ncbi:MAG TPA: long-chain-acyl-CoA synthetase [Caulobacteraceae bacterium]|jgi:fatty-acyl-CoA synthase|nr:long-chain-acyl-CoA synthetase [Caulobacteraceae bacterium]
MGLQTRIKRELKFLAGLVRTLLRVRTIRPDSTNLVCDDIEAAVDKWRERRAVTMGPRTLTYGELDEIANRYAHWAVEHGIRRGETVALYAPNRVDYLAIWYGLTKVGVATALINNNLAGAQLAHCVEIAAAAHAIVDAETAPALNAIRRELSRPPLIWTLGPPEGGLRDLTTALKSCSQLRPDPAVREGLTARETALYIYTSGTTGMPKAAKVNHMRVQLYMRGFAGSTNAKKDDRVYVTLPLYHATGGLCAMGAALLNGGSVVVRPRFSASHFWSDVSAEGCTMFVYIGELCRYLVNQPEQPGETTHPLKLAFGNGLRPEIWETVKTRFRIPEILEFYGSTEGNVSLFNLDGQPGAIGRIPGYARAWFNVRVARFDVEAGTVVRAANGRGIEASPGEIGECIGEIHPGARTEFSGYADRKASESKILHDMFKPGDAWFATGDLMRQDAEGYFYFVDRIGDTYRWKGENVSTGEVEQALSGLPGVKEASVYGVKVGELDGRAGMASLVVGPGFEISALAGQVDAALPAYARPVFVRLQPELAVTGTFKHRKIDMVAQGFDSATVTEPLYVRDGERGYTPITPVLMAKIADGSLRL